MASELKVIAIVLQPTVIYVYPSLSKQGKLFRSSSYVLPTQQRSCGVNESRLFRLFILMKGPCFGLKISFVDYCRANKNLQAVESLSVEASGFTKTRAFRTKSGQNISSSVGFTKTRAFAAKSGQNISSSLGVTKIRAFAWKCG